MTERPATLVLSGGGAKGAFQVGAERVLREEFGFEWEQIFSVSVGALNAMMLAQHEYQRLLSVWGTIREEDVYDKVGWPTIAWRLAVRKKLGIYDNHPLRRTIEKQAGASNYKVPAFVGRVSLITGQFELVPHTSPGFLDAVWESATMPIIWEPIAAQSWVDGGLRNVTPLGDALEHNPTELVVVVCNADAPEQVHAPRDIIDVAKRSLTDITINEIMINDIREFVRINEMVRQARAQGVTLRNENGQPFRYCPITVIRPERSLGDTLDFSHDIIEQRLHAGEEAARRALSTTAGNHA